MSDIATDTRAIAKRMKPWNSPSRTYASSDVPDSEYLRVTSLRLADAFEEVRADLQATQRENAKLREALKRMVKSGNKQGWNENYPSEMIAARKALAKAREARGGGIREVTQGDMMSMIPDNETARKHGERDGFAGRGHFGENYTHLSAYEAGYHRGAKRLQAEKLEVLKKQEGPDQ